MNTLTALLTNWLPVLLVIFIFLGILEHIESRYGTLTHRQPDWTKWRIQAVWDCRNCIPDPMPWSRYGSVGLRSRYISNTKLLIEEWRWMRKMKPKPMSDATGFPH